MKKEERMKIERCMPDEDYQKWFPERCMFEVCDYFDLMKLKKDATYRRDKAFIQAIDIELRYFYPREK